MSDALTLQEAADELGVHYMTAYRYVRLGLLVAHRNGRAWVVERDDLELFRAEREAPAEEADDAGRPKRHADWARRLERRLLAGDRQGAMGVLEASLAAGSDPVDVYVDVVAPAMEAIGSGWEAGEVDVAVEHRASVIISQTLAVLGNRFARRGVSRGVVVVGAAPNEQHALPVRIVADVIRLAGFEVQDLGADVPALSFGKAVAGVDRLLAVGISATMPGNEDAVRATIEAVRDAAAVPVFVGGRALPDRASAEAIGADHWAPDARAVVGVLDAISTHS